MNANNPKKVRAVECGNLANRIHTQARWSGNQIQAKTKLASVVESCSCLLDLFVCSMMARWRRLADGFVFVLAGALWNVPGP